MLDLDGRIAIVTGAARGLGQGISQELARAGACVAIGDLDERAAERTAAELRATGADAIAVSLDVTCDASIEACVSRVRQKFGRLDILVNNAGVHREKIGTPSTTDDFKVVFDVNLYGAWRMARACMEELKRSSAGRIINIASINGRSPWTVTPAYSASKAALINLTISLASEMGRDNVTVNAVCPGSVATAMADQFFDDVDAWRQTVIGRRVLKQELTPTDIGKAVVFFASPLADMITGQSLNVDGGLVML